MEHTGAAKLLLSYKDTGGKTGSTAAKLLLCNYTS